MKNKLPSCYAFKNTRTHPKKELIKARFNKMYGVNYSFNGPRYYGTMSEGNVDFGDILEDFGKGVTEITEDDFLASTEPEEQETDERKPHGFIQWKGTDVCMDIHCKCGHLSHIDGEYAYNVKCPKCGTVYMCNGNIELIELEQEPEMFILGD